MDVAELGFRINASDADRATRSLDNLSRSARNTETATERMNRENEQAARRFKEMNSSVGSALRVLRTFFVAMGGYVGAREIIQLSDAWKQVNNQLRQVTGSERELQSVRTTLLNVSRQTNTELDSTVALYSTLVRSTKELGLSSDDVAGVTKTVNQLFMASGASAMDAANAIRQLSQGLAAGALRGDEFNSVAENAPRIMDAIAEKLKMTRGELRAFAAEGGITSQILVESLQDYSEEAQRMAEQTDRTFGQRMVNARTNVTEFVGAMEGVNGAVSDAGRAVENFTKVLVENSREINEFLNDAIDFARGMKVILQEIVPETDSPWWMRPITQGPAGMIYRYLGFGGKAEFDSSLKNIQDGFDKIKTDRMEREFEQLEAQMLKNGEALLAWDGTVDRTTETVDGASDAVEKFTFTTKELADTIGGAAIKEVEAMAIEFAKLRDALYPQEAAVRGIMRQYQLLSAFAPQMRDRWLDANVKITTSTREAADAVQDLTDKADPMGEIYRSTIERTRGALADMFYDMFDKGKATFDNLLDLFKRMASEMAATKIFLAFGIGGAASSASAGSIGETGGAGLGDILSLGKISDFLSSNPLEGLDKLLTQIGGDSPFLTEMGMRLGDMTAMDIGLSALAGYAGNFLGGAMGEAIFGKEAESAWGATIGGVAGSFFGPIGALFGSTIGGLLDVAFGGDGKKRSAIGVQTSPNWMGADTKYSPVQIEAESGLLLTAYAKRAGDEAGELAAQMTQMFAMTDAALTDLFTTLGVTVDLAGQTLDGINSEFGEDDPRSAGFFGATGFNGELSAEDLAGAADAFVLAWADRVNELAGTAIDLAPLQAIQREGELLADVLLRANAQFAPVNAALDALGLAAYELSVQGMASADALVQMLGGLENFTAATSQYYQLFYSEEERLAQATEQLQGVFAGLNMAMPETNAQFRAIVEGLDLTTETGQATFATLMSIAPAFNQVTTAAEAAAIAAQQLAEAQAEQARQAQEAALAARNNTLADIAGTILGNYQDREKNLASLEQQLGSIDDQIMSVQEQIADASSPVADTIRNITASVDTLAFSSSQLRSIADNLLGTAASLRLGNLSPLTHLDRLEEAQRQYDEANRAAQSGDASGLASAAQAYLQQAAAYYASSPAYVQIFEGVVGNLEAMGVQMDAQADAAERQERAQAAQQASLAAIQAASTNTSRLTELYGELDKLMQEKQLIEQQIANLTATTSQDILSSQLDRLISITDGIDSMAALLGSLPASIADGLAQVIGMAIAEYRDLTPTEEFFDAVPAFASGGSYGGGLALVGEQGPELINFRTPGFVHNASDTRDLLSGDSGEVVGELKALRQEVAVLRKTVAEGSKAQVGATKETTRATEDVGRKLKTPVGVLS